MQALQQSLQGLYGHLPQFVERMEGRISRQEEQSTAFGDHVRPRLRDLESRINALEKAIGERDDGDDGDWRGDRSEKTINERIQQLDRAFFVLNGQCIELGRRINVFQNWSYPRVTAVECFRDKNSELLGFLRSLFGAHLSEEAPAQGQLLVVDQTGQTD